MSVTGKRAFEAASLMELMEMQERAAPASVTTLVRNWTRPWSASSSVVFSRSAEAAGLGAGGGRWIAGRRSAGGSAGGGRKPTPELVAAAGEPRAAAEGGGAVAGGRCWAVALAVFAPGQSVLARLPLDNSPEALTRDARTIIKSFGYTAAAGRYRMGADIRRQLSELLVQASQGSRRALEEPAAGQPPLAAFWYRESLGPWPRRWDSIWGSTMEIATGDVRDGAAEDRSRREAPGLRSVPSAGGGGGPALRAFDWARLFQAAGLDQSPVPARGSAVEPAGKLGRARGVDRGRSPDRSETARGSRGVARAAGVVQHRRSMDRCLADAAAESGQGQLASQAIVLLVFVAGCLLAWYNFRARRVDQRGAVRMSAWLFVCLAASTFLEMHHSATARSCRGFGVWCPGSPQCGYLWLSTWR